MKEKLENIKSSLYLFVSILVSSLFILLVFYGSVSGLVHDISKKIEQKRFIQDQYSYLENHSVWSELDDIYQFVYEHYPCDDEECNILKFEEDFAKVYAYCEAASIISDYNED